MSGDDASGRPPFDLQGMFAQIMDSAQQMQGRMKDVDARMAEVTVQGQSGGGIVVATATGKGRLKSIKIDPVAVDKRDVEMLEDLIVAAVNDALSRGRDAVEGELGKVAGGMDLGGLTNLFGAMGKK